MTASIALYQLSLQTVGIPPPPPAMTTWPAVTRLRIASFPRRSLRLGDATTPREPPPDSSRVDLPATLRSNPTYRKANPADAPVMILALTSRARSPGQVYDAISNLVQQQLARVEGVGDVEIGGASLPAGLSA